MLALPAPPPGTLPAHARLQVLLPLAGGLASFLGILLASQQGSKSAVGQILVATGAFMSGIVSATMLYNQLHTRYSRP